MQTELVNLRNSNKELLNLVMKTKEDCAKKMKDYSEKQEMVIKSIQESFQHELMKIKTELHDSNNQRNIDETCG